MTEKKKLLYLPIMVFCILETAFGILIQTIGGNVISFISVVSALVFAVVSFFIYSKNADGMLTASALLFTVCSDFCLIILEPRRQLLSMVFFSAVQVLYFIRLSLLGKKREELLTHILIRLSVIITGVLAAVIVLGEKTDMLSLISMFYYANLLVNFVYSLKYIRFSVMFSLGLLCFILCDTLVGLSEMGSLYFEFAEDSVIYRITHTELDLIWLFYVPSQTFLALSPIESTLKKEKGLLQVQILSI